MLTNNGLVKCVKQFVGFPYWYGCYGQIATKNLLKAKREQYPKYYTAKDFETQYGKRVFDCMGLIKYYMWSGGTGAPSYKAAQDLGCTGMYKAAKTKGKIGTFPKTPGLLVFKGSASKKTHVGVYVGNNKVIEAKGHAYGVIVSDLTANNWTYWAQCPFIGTNKAVTPAPAPAPAPVPSVKKYHVVKRGDTMWAIAKKYGVSLAHLRKLNPHIKNINLIYPGQKVYY